MPQEKARVNRIIPVQIGAMSISIKCNNVPEDVATERVMHAITKNGWAGSATPRELVAKEIADMQIWKARMRARA